MSDAALFAHATDADGRVTSSPVLTLLCGGVCAGDALVTHALPWDDDARADAAAAALGEGAAGAAGDSGEDRAMGALLGLAVGDALGAPLEFMPVRDHGTPPSLAGMLGAEEGALLPDQRAHNVFRLRPGQWTDDTAMALCVADSLLASGFALRPSDLMLRFAAWWHAGYNNAFTHDEERGDKCVLALLHGARARAAP
jgi:ADP-ribosyl-[dinitrogen reductase] hydrolase